jgi:TolB protein
VSADGEWIAFMSAGVQEDIHVIKNDGTGLRRLTDDVHKDRRPRWAPDGKRLLFDSNRAGRFELWQINFDGSGLSQLTHTTGPPALQAVWSPTGAEVAFSRSGDVPAVLSLASPSEIRPLSAQSSGDTWRGVTSWSADGKGLAFHVIGPNGPKGTGVYRLKDANFVQLTNDGAAPTWVSDSRHLLYETGTELHLMDPISRRDQVIFRTDPYTIELASRSGGVREWIYFSLLSTEADVWSFELQ